MLISILLTLWFFFILQRQSGSREMASRRRWARTTFVSIVMKVCPSFMFVLLKRPSPSSGNRLTINTTIPVITGLCRLLRHLPVVCVIFRLFPRVPPHVRCPSNDYARHYSFSIRRVAHAQLLLFQSPHNRKHPPRR